MQTGTVPNRITIASHLKQVKLVNLANQVVLDDWRLRNWVASALGGAWAAPTTAFNIVTGASGDYIRKSTTAWDYGYQDLGVNTPVTLCDGVTTDTPYVSSANIAAGKDLVCFYANNFRGRIGLAGIYVVKCYDDGAGNLFWSQPITVDQRVATADWNQSSQSFATFPRIQVINGEYWILALSCSREINVITYHLVYYRSKDGEHWTRREILAGVSSDASQSTIGVNQHNAGTAFTLADLRHAYLNIIGTNLYIVSKLGATNFVCPATSLVGVTNNATIEDLTPYVQAVHISRPTSPTLLQCTYDLFNDSKRFDSDALLVPGARIVHKAGYKTTSGEEMLTYAVEYIDQISGQEEISPNSYKNGFQLTTSDKGMRLRDLSDDQPYEWYSPAQEAYDQFCDLTALGVVGGRMYVGYGGSGTDLTCDVLDPNSQVDESLGYFPQIARPDGTVEFQFQFTNAVTIWLTAAGVFQGVNSRQFYSIAYWVVLGKWVIAQALPTSAGNKLYTYQPIYNGSAQVLSPNTNYWLKVAQYHNHVMAWTSSDRITWTKVIDYNSFPTTPITASHSYWGLLGHSHGTPSTAIGNNDASGGKVAMDDGAGNPKWWAVRVQVVNPGILSAVGGLFTQTGLPSMLTLGVAKDNAGNMSDITVASNVLYSVSTPAIWYSNSDAPVWRFPPIPQTIPVAAGFYWVYVTFNSALGAGQTWEWYTDAAGTHGTTQSSANGSTWAAVAGKSMAAFITVTESVELAKFNNVYWSSGEASHTLEDLVAHTVAKGHVLSLTPQDFVNSGTLSGGWQPSAAGTLGDFVLDCDVSGANAEIYFRATTNGNALTGYKIVIASTLLIYWQNVLKTSIDCMQPIPASYHLRIANQTQWLYIWINESLAGIFYTPDAITPGYFGTGVATFTNLRIPEMTQVIPYHILETGETPLAALGKLMDKTPYKWFVRYDESLAVGSFAQASSADTYTDTVFAVNPVKTNRYAVNQVQPTSDHWALRWSAKLLDTVGLRMFKKFDYTRAFSNEDAYRDGKRVLDLAEQQGTPYRMKSLMAVWAAEPEDRITAKDGNDYYIDSIDITHSIANAQAEQELVLRKVV